MAHPNNRKVTQSESSVMNIRSVLSGKNNPEFLINMPNSVNIFKAYIVDDDLLKHVDILLNTSSYNIQIEKIKKISIIILFLCFNSSNT